jgi:DNA-binding CsgD family transcriptional regulator
VLTVGRRIGAPAALALALAVSAETKWWSGQWAAGYADAVEAVHWATEYDHAAVLGYALSMLARFEAARGDVPACRAHVERAGREAETRGVECVRIHGLAALGLAALSVADLPTALDRLDNAWRIATAEGLGNPNPVPMAGDLAEALARGANPERCRRVIGWLEERAEATRLSYPRVVATRARGLLADDAGEAQRWFQASLSALTGECPMPFERARTELVLGEALRRARRPAEAREPLIRAALRFEKLGARVWARRARAELGASGVKSPCPSAVAAPTDVDCLSPQELHVARAAARGLNNVEIAARLFISRKTVEAHLSRTYRKLNIRSRVELARLLLSAGISD